MTGILIILVKCVNPIPTRQGYFLSPRPCISRDKASGGKCINPHGVSGTLKQKQTTKPIIGSINLMHALKSTMCLTIVGENVAFRTKKFGGE